MVLEAAGRHPLRLLPFPTTLSIYFNVERFEPMHALAISDATEMTRSRSNTRQR